MKKDRAAFLMAALMIGGSVGVAGALSPIITSWQTAHSSSYAKVIEYVGGSPVTTWPSSGLPNRGGGQATPAYSDVQLIKYSTNYVYISSTDLASFTMGPWGDGNGGIFGNWPSNQMYQMKFPRNPTVPTTKDKVTLGAIGLWANGTAIFNGLDAFSYSTSGGTDAGNMGPGAHGDGIWNRTAIAAETVTFDPANAHQPQNGEYHTHANPVGVRYQMGDNVVPSGSTWVESSAAKAHSPILGWAYDGYPVYGPYAHSDPNDATSPITRMRSGYTKRDGTLGTTNLTSTGRHSLAKWAADLQGKSQTLTASQYGPAINTARPLGWYAEDFDFLGDHGYTQGTDFDLDVYNGRFCKTPDFPSGTYAYFVTIDAAGAPAYPYVLGSQYRGHRDGGKVTTVSEPTTTYFDRSTVTNVEAWVIR